MARGGGSISGGGGDDGGGSEPLLPRKASSYTRSRSHAGDELRSFRSCLRWMCVDQSDPFHTAASWSLFLLLSLAVPLASHFLLSYSPSRRAYDLVVQLALTSVASLSYLSLSSFVHRYGLRRFLFLDRLRHVSERVRTGYAAQLNRSFRLLSFFVLPCFLLEVAYKLSWYLSGEEAVPPSLVLLGSPLLTEAVACSLEVASWIYRTAIFFLVCVLFRLICHLQILRMQDFAAAFQEGTAVGVVLKEHLRIRRQLTVISHRCRGFLLGCICLVTVSQFSSLLLTTWPHAMANLFNAGEIFLCSMVMVTGLLICLRSAAKITHKAQAITSHAATWHAFATINSSDADLKAPPSPPEGQTSINLGPPSAESEEDEEEEEEEDEEEVGDEDELDHSKLMPSQINTICFQKRQALVTYLENNRGGITVFGFVVDRTWLHALFMIEMSLALWLLGKTIGIS